MIKRKKGKNKKIFSLFLVFAVLLALVIFIKIAPFLNTAFQLTFNKNIELKKTFDQRVNILLLGIGGGVHDGPLLTDTIIFLSIDPQLKKSTLVSIPRDLWVYNMQAKINTVYAYAETDKPGSGLQKTKDVVSGIVGQQIDYGFRIDFTGFEKAVDLMGGLDIDVDRAFDDYDYPLSGKETDTCGLPEEQIASLSAQISTGSATTEELFPCRYEHLHFNSGLIHMDGETALKFVRSRHALGPEGSDFARSKRQEKIIRAFKDKVFSAQTFLNPVRVIGLFDVLKASIDTDIKQEEYDDFIKLAQKMREGKIESAVIDTGDEQLNTPGLLINPLPSDEYKFQWVLIPKLGSNNYSDIHAFISCELKYGSKCVATPTPVSSK